MKKIYILFIFIIAIMITLIISIYSEQSVDPDANLLNTERKSLTTTSTISIYKPYAHNSNEEVIDLATAANSLTKDEVTYDPTYFSIPYPMGDIPKDRGVCTDVVIRAYRKLGIDLQELVHKDMVKNFSSYPQKWGLNKTDTNIDHRRVENLATFFARYGTTKAITNNPDDYIAGDIVVWDLGQGIKHIGIVSSKKSSTGTNMVVHNIGSGQVLEDVLFSYKIIGHYRYSKADN
jgi:uncharacterized protein YijF (DUF1287 family)